jgi:hypothetical protein
VIVTNHLNLSQSCIKRSLLLEILPDSIIMKVANVHVLTIGKLKIIIQISNCIVTFFTFDEYFFKYCLIYCFYMNFFNQCLVWVIIFAD